MILPTAWEDLKNDQGLLFTFQFGVESAMKVTDQILNSIERFGVIRILVHFYPDKWLNRKGIT